MPVNLELKIRVSNRAELLKAAEALGAVYTEDLRQRDVYFIVSDGLLKLRLVNDRAELIKYSRDESGAERWSDYRILHIEGDDPESYFRSFLQVETVVEKMRTLYMYKSTRIHFDEVESLGRFLELETVTGESPEEAASEFDAVVEGLGLDTASQLRCSYRDLLLEKENG